MISPDISYVHRGPANGRDQINILCEIGGSGTAFRPLSANLPPDPPGGLMKTGEDFVVLGLFVFSEFVASRTGCAHSHHGMGVSHGRVNSGTIEARV